MRDVFIDGEKVAFLDVRSEPSANGTRVFDQLAEARAERDHGQQADVDLRAALGALNELHGETLYEALRRRADRLGSWHVACDRYEQALRARDDRIAQLEGQAKDAEGRHRFLNDELTARSNELEEARTALTEERTWSYAALTLLRSAVRAERHRKPERRGKWLTAAGELLSKRADGR